MSHDLHLHDTPLPRLMMPPSPLKNTARKDDFLSTMSHELRTPLNGIIGLSESLVAGSGGRLPEKVRVYCTYHTSVTGWPPAGEGTCVLTSSQRCDHVAAACRRRCARVFCWRGGMHVCTAWLNMCAVVYTAGDVIKGTCWFWTGVWLPPSTPK